MSQAVRVKIADLAVIKDSGMLVTVGLGSCVGVALYDAAVRVAGLAHILLADSSAFAYKTELNPAKFADTAVPLLVQQMKDLGARTSRLQAKIAGGSQLFTFENSLMAVGDKNVRAVRDALSSLGIPLLAADVGGNAGRTMKISAGDGVVTVSTVGGPEREL